MLELQFTGQDAAFQVVVNGEISHMIQKEQLISLDKIDKLDIKPYGQTLYDLLFPDASHAHTTLKSISPLHTERICLVVGESPLLNAIPWEYLFDGTYYLAARHHLLRALPQDKRREWQVTDNHLNLYALLSNPALSENEPIAIKKAWDDLTSVVRSRQGIHLRRVEPPTMQNLRDHLQPNGVNLVHFLCHGGVDQEAVLALQNTYGQEELVPASRVIESVRNKASLVILNACMSATVGNNPLSNLAYALVEWAVPYAIGMQFDMIDSATFVLSKTLYGELLKGYSIEEAVRQARNSLLDTSELKGREFWAGVPVLYTAVKDMPPSLKLDTAEAQITPAPDWIAQRQHLTELAAADRLVGRGAKIVEVNIQLQKERDRRAKFITLHGVGGVGKTSLAANVAQYNAWTFDYRVFGISLEVLPSSQSFVDRLISLYLGETPATWDAEKRQSALIEKVTSTASLLILDNLETVLDAVDNKNAEAQKIVSIILNLAGGATAILITTRVITHWQDEVIIELGGLTDDDGGKLFKSLLNRRKSAISNEQARQISHRLGGHPLSLRLTASEFERDSQSFEAFHQELEEILIAAEDREIKNLRDPERQKTLIGCIDYSVKKLPEHLKAALRDLSLFLNPFLPEMASHVLQQEDATPVLRELHDRALLEYRQEALELKDGEITVLNFYSLHPTVRWFASWDMPTPDTSVTLRYTEVFDALLKPTQENYWGDKHLRLIFNTALDDFKRAGYHLQQRDKGIYLSRMGDVHRLRREFAEALERYGEALAILRTVDDKRSVAVTLHSMGDVHSLRREFAEALERYGEALAILRTVDDKREVAVTLSSMGDVHSLRREFAEALERYGEALAILRTVDDKREVAVTLSSMGNVHRLRREFAEALERYGEALAILRTVDDKRSVAVTLHSMGDVHSLRREFAEALERYGEALAILRTVDDKRSVAVTLHSMGDVHSARGEFAEALERYGEALAILRTVDDKREVAVTLSSMGNVHRLRREFAEALERYGEALAILRTVDDKRSVALTLSAMGDVHSARGEFAEALELYGEALAIKRTVDDKRSVAITLGMMSQVYWEQAQYPTAIDTLWQAFQSIIQVDDPHTAQAMAEVLQHYKSQLGDEQFDALWEQMTDKPQPEWLQNTRDTMFQTIIGKTYAVFTTHASQKSAWRQDLINVKGQAAAQNDNEMMTFCDALIALLDAEGQFDGITTAFEGPYLAAWEQLKSRLTQKDDE